jgi:hypothetical protein
MNECFSNLLYEIQKDEIMKKAEVEKKRIAAIQRQKDLLKGNPFKLKTMERAKEKNSPP